MSALFHTLLPKQLLTCLAGIGADVKIPWIKNTLIKQFIKHYRVNMQEALDPNPTHYATFNDFFIRKLNPTVRTLEHASLICPVDGSISEYGTIESGQLLQAKGRYYTVQDLIQSEEHARAFNQGKFITLYLSPKDYHRIHMPIKGTVKSVTYIPGSLFSVQPKTTQCIPQLFARNERVVVLFDTPLGSMAMVLVGATIVGKIAVSWHGEFKRAKVMQTFSYPTPITLEQGQEMGYFKLGSTVILLFEKQIQLTWPERFKPSALVQYGQTLTTC